MGEKIVVDGANVAYEDKDSEGNPKIASLMNVRRKLQEAGYEPIIIVDASFRHVVDDQAAYDKLEREGVIEQAPAGTDADYFVIKIADDLGAKIVSNDRYDPYRDQHPWLDDRRVPVMIVDGLVEFYELEPAKGDNRKK